MRKFSLLPVMLFTASAAAQNNSELFEARVRPVLVRSCQGCHGADKAFAGLRVDSREALAKGGQRGPAISADSPRDSLLLRAIRHEGGLAMPMGGTKLKDAEIAALSEWVAAGAVWPVAAAAGSPAAKAGTRPADWYERAARTHWSFQPVKAAPAPMVRDPSWPGNEVDRFLLAALEAKGLAPAKPADKRTLIRRASLILTGLPPAPAEIERFLNDNSPGAFERAAARMLDSPHFGEHWARHWMDVMRYGETRGYEWNYEVVGAWRYRDYLIRAFNADVPFDQLVREHIAGDLLAKPRINEREGVNESVIGTTFFRLGEAGHDDCIKFREISLDVVDNQIDTLGKAFQGLTLACARCHDHKLDPIPTNDYYGLFGVLNSSRTVTHTIDAGRDFTAGKRELDGLKNQIRAEVARLWLERIDSMKLTPRKAGFDDPLFPWLAMRPADAAVFGATWSELAALYKKEDVSREAFNRASFTPFGEFSQGAGGWLADGLGLRGNPPSGSGDVAIATEGEQALSAILPAGLHTNTYTDRWNGALRSPLLPKNKKYLSVRLMGGQLAARRTVLDNCAIGEGYRTIENASPAWVRLDTVSGEKLPAFVEVITKSDNPRIPDRPGMVKATEAELASPRSHFGALRAVLHDTAEAPREELGHLRRLFADGASVTSLSTLEARYREIARAAVKAWAEGRADDDDVRWLDSLLRSGALDNRAAASGRLAELVAEYRRRETELLPTPRVVDGMGDAGPGFDTPVLVTGNPQAPGAVTPRHFLSRIGPASQQQPLQTQGSGRRELAELIASPENPLTARVMVNRVWKQVFGRGLVATVDNFGREGERPSHPELLDYLAARFVREGWSVKKLVRLLVSSRAFAQSGEVKADAREIDPQNTLLHHFPLRRMPAESLRDSILMTSGELDRALFGRSIPPHRAEPQDYRRLFSGPLNGAGRRSVYTQITRMEGPRFLEIFDYPNPMAARGARDVTNVPAQALAMLNDPFVIAQAKVWGERVARDSSPTAQARIDAMFQAALGRAASAAERERFAGLAAELASLQGVPREQLLSHPGVWKDVAHAMFNLKEFLYIR